MVIFLDEERAYLSWTGHHREGFVLDALRRPTRKRPTLHRAGCGEVRSATIKRTHWTTGRRLKACALDRDELVAWSEHEYGAAPAECTQCTPTRQQRLAAASSGDDARSLTHLGKELVDFVVEAAVIQLDHDQCQYNLTVGDLASSFGKTPGQLTPALLRLVEDGYLRIEGKLAPGRALPKRRGVYPTATALRTLPAFEPMSQRAIAKELRRLASEA